MCTGATNFLGSHLVWSEKRLHLSIWDSGPESSTAIGAIGTNVSKLTHPLAESQIRFELSRPQRHFLPRQYNHSWRELPSPKPTRV